MAEPQPQIMTIVTSQEVPHAREGEIAFELTVRVPGGEPFRLTTHSRIPIRVRHFNGRFPIAQIRRILTAGVIIRAPITHLDPGCQREQHHRQSDRAVDPRLIQAVAYACPLLVRQGHLPTATKARSSSEPTETVRREVLFNAGSSMGSREEAAGP